MELRFCQEDGDLIEKDGLLIVHRKYWVIPYVDGAPSNHVVKITRGRARIPQEWAIGSCWISPFHGGILPGYNLSIIPLIPEYAAKEYEASPIPWLQPNHFDADGDGTIIVVKRPGSGWESCQRALRRRFEKAGDHAPPDLRLPDIHYFRVKRFIQAELRRHELEKGPN